jgi:nicotinamidase-related amidase
MLVIIDCQAKYPAANQVVNAVANEVKRARKRNEWVMLVEYKGDGRTLTRITLHLRGYRKVVKVTKEHDDGSPVIFDRIFGHRWSVENNLDVAHISNIRHLRVCGVNSSACVMKTVHGLRRFVKTTVLSKACANGYARWGLTPEQMHEAAMERMSKWPNVYVKK